MDAPVQDWLYRDRSCATFCSGAVSGSTYKQLTHVTGRRFRGLCSRCYRVRVELALLLGLSVFKERKRRMGVIHRIGGILPRATLAD